MATVCSSAKPVFCVFFWGVVFSEGAVAKLSWSLKREPFCVSSSGGKET